MMNRGSVEAITDGIVAIAATIMAVVGINAVTVIFRLFIRKDASRTEG